MYILACVCHDTLAVFTCNHTAVTVIVVKSRLSLYVYARLYSIIMESKFKPVVVYPVISNQRDVSRILYFLRLHPYSDLVRTIINMVLL